MSATVKLSSALPADLETNGLDDMVDDLLADRATIRLGLVWFDVAQVTDKTDTGEHIPTVRVRRFEPLGDADDVTQAVRDLAMEAAERRTGRTPLPFGEIDPNGVTVLSNGGDEGDTEGEGD